MGRHTFIRKQKLSSSDRHRFIRGINSTRTRPSYWLQRTRRCPGVSIHKKTDKDQNLDYSSKITRQNQTTFTSIFSLERNKFFKNQTTRFLLLKIRLTFYLSSILFLHIIHTLSSISTSFKSVPSTSSWNILTHVLVLLFETLNSVFVHSCTVCIHPLQRLRIKIKISRFLLTKIVR